MNRIHGITSIYAVAIGAFLLIEGIWALFSPVVFGVLTTSMGHAVIHILLGALGIWTGFKEGSRTFCIALGVLLLTAGILRFIPGIGAFMASTLNTNLAVAYLNIAIGVVSLLVAFAAGRPHMHHVKTA